MHTLYVKRIKEEQLFGDTLECDQARLVLLHYLTQLTRFIVPPRVAVSVIVSSDNIILSKTDTFDPDFDLGFVVMGTHV